MQRHTATVMSTDGFAVLPQLVGRAELFDLQAQVDRVMAQPLPPGCRRPHNTLAPLRWDSPLVARMLADDRRVRAVAAAAAAADLRWISGYVSVKDPRSEALEWHQDWWCWDHPVSYRGEAPQVALLCYRLPPPAWHASQRRRRPPRLPDPELRPGLGVPSDGRPRTPDPPTRAARMRRGRRSSPLSQVPAARLRRRAARPAAQPGAAAVLRDLVQQELIEQRS
jgi:hypothetical protein